MSKRLARVGLVLVGTILLGAVLFWPRHSALHSLSFSPRSAEPTEDVDPIPAPERRPTDPARPNPENGRLRPMPRPTPMEKLVGIGVVLRKLNNASWPTVMNVLPNSPAANSGVESGSFITKIDDTSTDGMNLSDCVSMLRGAEGSSVRLELVHPEKAKTNTLELIRQQLRP